MHVAHLTLHDFRSWADLELELEPGVTALVGRNGQGKTNVVEAIDYLSSLGSHRVSGDAPLVRREAAQAIVRAAVIRDDRRAVLEIEINPGRSNRARINRSPLPKARELLGLVKTVVFSPEDLALVKGDPSERRRFADDLLVQLTPKYAGTRGDYDRVLKQRNSLLKSAGVARRGGSTAEAALATLAVWDDRLVDLGTEIVIARDHLVTHLLPRVGEAYAAVARGATNTDATLAYRPSFGIASSADAGPPGETPDGEARDQDPPVLAEPGPADVPSRAPTAVARAFRDELARRQRDELDRGLTLVGPHRDDIALELGGFPVRGYASHGESWSFALALRLASYDLLRSPDVGEGDDPILILDDVFAELDTGRRDQLAELVAGAEQVLITAAVPEDVPEQLRGRRFVVADGEIRADD